MTFNQFPILKFLIMIIIGVVISDYLNLSFTISALSFFSGICLLIVIGFFCKSNMLRSTSFFVSFLMIGILTFISHHQIKNEKHFSRISVTGKLIVKVMDLRATANGYRIQAEVINIVSSDTLVACMGKLMIYTDDTTNINVYDFYTIPLSYKKVESFQNPGIFNYGKYLQNQNIFHTSFIKSNQISFYNSAPQLLGYIRDLKLLLVNFYNEKIEKKSHSGIINALLLGQKQMLDMETKSLFTNNGLAHLLAVSGMHVGIILVILSTFLTKVPFHLIRNTLIIIGIWLYILITGMQLPAIRAGFMISVYIIGKMIGRNTKPLNSLFFAAMVLICITPKIIFQLSFQLSFAAMLSIFLFYDKIYHIFIFDSIIFDKIWQLLALNVSVQILILPISIYYFHQFPTYFLFNSLITFPFVILIMWISVFGAMLFWFSELNDILFKMLDFILNVFELFLNFTDKLPLALVNGIQLNGWKFVFLIFGILGFYFFYYHKKRNKIKALYCLIPFLITESVLTIMDSGQKQIIVYDHPNKIAIDLISSLDTFRISNKELNKSDWFYMPAKSTDYNNEKNIQAAIENIECNGTEFKYFSKTGLLFIGDQDLEPDIDYNLCVLGNNLPAYSTLKNCQKIIIPSYFSEENKKEIKTCLSEIRLPFYDISKRGAFILKFK